MSAKREYAFALLAGVVGAGVVLLAAREQWAQALFTQPKPLPAQVVDVSGNDLVPLASAATSSGPYDNTANSLGGRNAGNYGGS